MADLEELAGRVEGLSGPSREVDALIAIAIDWTSELYGPARDLLKSNSASDIGKYLRDLPNYTASIDSAMTLVPEGYDWSTSSEQGRGVAYTISRSSEFSDDTTAATPALALVSAALRACARTQGNPNG